MVSDKMAKALNAQLNFELYSAYIYLAMSAHADNVGLKGFANWFYTQYQEEMLHATKFFQYIMDRSVVELETIEKPRKVYKDSLEMFEETLKHEREVTARINSLATLAYEEKDHATGTFLQWFINEQVEEESSVKEILDKLKLAGATSAGLFMINNELGTRVFTPPADPAAQ